MADITDHGWAAFWLYGVPRPFLLVHSTRTTRKASCESVGEMWALPGQTPMQGWRRAYRQGCRVGRVTLRVNPAYYPDFEEPKQ